MLLKNIGIWDIMKIEFGREERRRKMIECEVCGEYFHSDDIQSCPKCGDDICEGCFQEHVKQCRGNGNEENE